MSDKDLDATILVTQQVLGKYIKKPPLTEKLLRKPPFRFLMDVFNNFIKQTGKLEGLYTPEEQTFENITSRDDKIRFLQKMIDAIKLITKMELKVRTSKIVAGQEPELTNELLQAMASVAEKNLEWDAVVDQVVIAHSKTPIAITKPPKETKVSGKNPSPAGKEEDPKRRKEKRISPQEQKVRKANDPATRSSPSEKEKVSQKKSKVTKDDSKLGKQNSKQKTPSPVKQKSKTKVQISTESDNFSMSMSPVPAGVTKQSAPEPSPAKKAVETVEKNISQVSPTKPKEPVVEPVQETPPASLAPPPEPESRKSSGRSRRSSGSHKQPEPNPVESQPQPAVPSAETNLPQETNNSEAKREIPMSRENSKESNQRPRTSLRPPSARPASARPGAPRRRNVEIVLQPNDQVKMSGINVKLETFGDLDDDGENLVIIEDANAHDIAEGGGGAEEPALEGQLDAQGRLVQQILETQKELVHQNAEVEPLQSQAARQSSARQVNDLRDVIQSLTKAVNPLGKLLDFIPEDIDAMQLELTMWRDTYTQASMDLKRERSLTASATEPMKHQLQQIQASIAEYRELIDESRHKIQQNNARILKLMMEQ
ncbi:TRAF3-interacting protein 1 [Drosophila ficusphila]|uniref:TRAF3-interacting protein 1 n=1 Tax=Drosophila ficusphila TaxID=30025 RepID=UPI0007E6F9B5|nr:TRAF3-interacting protein 1 [Drosophila ficusphila]